MSQTSDSGNSGWVPRAVGLLLVIAILAVQTMVFSRIVGAAYTKQAEAQLDQLSQLESQLDNLGANAANEAEVIKLRGVRRGLLEQIESRLTRALAADSANGMACWFLSKAYLSQAQVSADLMQQAGQRAGAAKAAGNDRLAAQYAAAAQGEREKRDKLLKSAEEWAYRGRKSFNSVGCFKQLASIHLRQGQAERAEPYLEIVTRIKPDDIEAVERLGLLKLNPVKWDELPGLCDQILQRHPYSANAYYYKAYMAQEALKEKRGNPETNTQDLHLNARQAYLMWRQKTGEIFFDWRNLEQMVKSLNLVEARRPGEAAARPP